MFMPDTTITEQNPQTLYELEIVSRSPKVCERLGKVINALLGKEKNLDKELAGLYREDESEGKLNDDPNLLSSEVTTMA